MMPNWRPPPLTQLKPGVAKRLHTSYVLMRSGCKRVQRAAISTLICTTGCSWVAGNRVFGVGPNFPFSGAFKLQATTSGFVWIKKWNVTHVASNKFGNCSSNKGLTVFYRRNWALVFKSETAVTLRLPVWYEADKETSVPKYPHSIKTEPLDESQCNVRHNHCLFNGISAESVNYPRAALWRFWQRSCCI